MYDVDRNDCEIAVEYEGENGEINQILISPEGSFYFWMDETETNISPYPSLKYGPGPLLGKGEGRLVCISASVDLGDLRDALNEANRFDILDKYSDELCDTKVDVDDWDD